MFQNRDGAIVKSNYQVTVILGHFQSSWSCSELNSLVGIGHELTSLSLEYCHTLAVPTPHSQVLMIIGDHQTINTIIREGESLIEFKQLRIVENVDLNNAV